jgi:hypothetical protein
MLLKFEYFENMIDVEAQKVSIIISNMLIIYNYSGCQLKKISISKVIYYISHWQEKLMCSI